MDQQPIFDETEALKSRAFGRQQIEIEYKGKDKLLYKRMVNLSDKEWAMLQEIEQKDHQRAYVAWKEFEKLKSWNTIMEKSKAMEAFFMGFACKNYGGGDAD